MNTWTIVSDTFRVVANLNAVKKVFFIAFTVSPPPARNLSPVPQRISNDDVNNSGMWSRFRSLSVNNFAYFTAAVNSTTGSARDSSCNNAHSTDDKSGNNGDGAGEADYELLLSRNEMSRCISLPNIDTDAVGFDLTEMDDI